MTNPATPQAPPVAPAPCTAHPAARTPLLLLTGILFSLAASAATATAGPQPFAYAAAPATLPARLDTLTEPIVIRSDPATRTLDARLAVVMANLPVPTSGTWPLRAYQFLGANTNPRQQPPTFPGPTFRVRPGDLVRINLSNQLGPLYTNDACEPYPAVDSINPPVDTFQDCFHGPNYTNIHYHGMHVTPESTSTAVGDDVLLLIAPGGSLQYSFRIPQNQSPGTHWYHPHKHGSVALQVTNGMSGALIVEGGGLDSLTRALGMREHLIALQEIDPHVNLVDNSIQRVRLVNGQANPTIVMRTNEVQRWRIVNENVSKTSTFTLLFQGQNPPALFDVARDGVQFAPANYDAVNPDTRLVMAPGNRLDVFVRAPGTTGTATLSVQVAETDQPTRKPQARAAAPQAAPPPAPLLTVTVVDTGPPVNTTLPTSLPATPWDVDLPEQGGNRPVIVFTDDTVHMPPDTAKTRRNPPRFYLGSVQDPLQKFNDAVVFVPSDSGGTPMPMVLNATQTWRIENRSQLNINHPFHIHINPFQVNRVVYFKDDSVYAPLYDQLNAAAARGHPIWLDVLPLPQSKVDANGQIDSVGYAIITQRYDDFAGCTDCGPPTGEFVMHCHILGHEERGMMQVLDIVGPGETPGIQPHPAMHAVPPAPAPPAPPPAPERERMPVRKDPPRSP